MEFIKDWTLCICTTLIVAIILSYLCPISKNGKFYRMLVKIFILVAFIVPFKSAEFRLPKENLVIKENDIISYQRIEANSILENKIYEVLKNGNISGANIKILSNINSSNEIDVKKIIVIVPDEYNCNEIKKLIFEKLSLNVDVTYIGQ